LKTLAAFTFPNGEPFFTKEVSHLLRKNTREMIGENNEEVLGIQRICEKNPEISKGLEDLMF